MCYLNATRMPPAHFETFARIERFDWSEGGPGLKASKDEGSTVRGSSGRRRIPTAIQMSFRVELPPVGTPEWLKHDTAVLFILTGVPS